MQRLVLALLILITGGVILFLVAMIFVSAPPPAPGARPAPDAPAAGLLIPVEGVRPAQLRDTFAEARGAGRPHDAIDIMAPRGTPVIAAAAGIVEKLFFSQGGGGVTVYVRSPDRRWVHYYAHLDGYALGLREGQAVGRGAAIGRVGSTGNASATAPHLHFAVHAMRPGERWWQGRPVNPYPLLAAGEARR